jgi:ABC-type transport system involved in cytochrome c biogenesis permease subunit
MSTIQTTPAPAATILPPLPRPQPSPRSTAPDGLFWGLVAALAVVSLAVAALGWRLFASHLPSPAPAVAARIALPHAAFDWDGFRRWVVQEDGRNKPFDSFCREAVRTVTGRERFEGNDPVAVVVAWMLLHHPDRARAEEIHRQAGCDWEHHPFILCDYGELRELIYRDLRGDPTPEELHGKYVAPADLRNSIQFQDLLRQATLTKRKDAKAPLPALQAKALEVSRRLDLYDRTAEGAAFGVVALDRCAGVWFSVADVRRQLAEPGAWEETLRNRRAEFLPEYAGKPAQPFPQDEAERVATAYAALEEAYRTPGDSSFTAAATSFFDTVANVSQAFHPYPHTTTTELELKYNRLVPFQKAWLFGLLASVVLAAGVVVGARWPFVGRGFYFGGLLAYGTALIVSGLGFYCRVAISGRPPVSNMYESVVWVAFATALIGLGLELVYRQGVIALAGALVSTLGFVLADQLPLALDPKISPLVAVLRSNYWLIIHVLTIVSSYAAFALAWGLGNLNLGLILFAPGRGDLVRTLSQFSYRAIQVGVLLLFAGTMLGGFWAAESWGRFWGWDPKEVWALIAFLCYIIPLHARYVGWVKDFGLAVCSVVCFAAVVMAWYGVNFVLAAGLHSYGFGGGDNLWVAWAALLNIDLVLAGALSYRRLRRAPVPV